MCCQNAPMFSLSRKFVAALLLVTITLTVMSPHFAWEASAADTHHDAETGALALYGAGEAPACCNVDIDHHDDHACSGHMFSHLPVQASDTRIPPFIATADTFDSLAESGYLSRTPDSLDRPPKHRLA